MIKKCNNEKTNFNTDAQSERAPRVDQMMQIYDVHFYEVSIVNWIQRIGMGMEYWRFAIFLSFTLFNSLSLFLPYATLFVCLLMLECFIFSINKWNRRKRRSESNWIQFWPTQILFIFIRRFMHAYGIIRFLMHISFFILI